SGRRPKLDDLIEVVDAAAAAEPVFFAEVSGKVAIVYSADSRMRGRILAASGAAALTAGESTEASLTELGRARREAEQALSAGARAGRQHTSFADIGPFGLVALLA